LRRGVAFQAGFCCFFQFWRRNLASTHLFFEKKLKKPGRGANARGNRRFLGFLGPIPIFPGRKPKLWGGSKTGGIQTWGSRPAGPDGQPADLTIRVCSWDGILESPSIRPIQDSDHRTGLIARSDGDVQHMPWPGNCNMNIVTIRT
jgi:hypothetical protein